MRKGRDGEKKWKKKMENNDENSGPLTSLPVDRLTACSPATTTLVPIIAEILTTITLASRLPDIAPTATLLLVPIIFISNAKMPMNFD